MKRAAFYTLGCKVNQYETEAIAELFENKGYNIVNFDETADIYVINTCTVTGMSDRKSRQIIRRAKALNSDAVVVVTGCYAQTDPGEVSNIPGVNLVIGTRDRDKILDYLMQLESGSDCLNVVVNITNDRKLENLKVNLHKGHTRAFVKIQDGCSQFCSYCIVPFARGPVRSRLPDEIDEEVKKLAAHGFKEIVLTGIHIASYGKDIQSASLQDIIRRVNEAKGIERIRLGSLEPAVITDEFVDTIKQMPKLCPHYHVSLQSGCDATLRRMNRRYTVDGYRKKVGLLRESINDVAITTDIMVGFPGETDDEFEQTYKFIKQIAFTGMHVFKYSPRKGTSAAAFTDQVAPGKKEERSNRLIRLSKECMQEFNDRFRGRIMSVLIEQESKDTEGYIEGLTANYIRVLCKGDNCLKGRLVNIKLLDAHGDYFIGEITEHA